MLTFFVPFLELNVVQKNGSSLSCTTPVKWRAFELKMIMHTIYGIDSRQAANLSTSQAIYISANHRRKPLTQPQNPP